MSNGSLASSLTDAVAVIGVAFRLPGATTWDELIDVFAEGRDCVGPMPPARAARTGITLTGNEKHGGWLADITGFDHRYFGIARAEAELIDPRQRLVLQLAVEAIGNAGYVPADLAGRRVAVLVAAHGGPHPGLYDLLDERDRADGQAFTGSLHAFAAGRLSYHLDLRGPAQAIDTACSSFLVALHEARAKLARGEADLALVGGCELVLGEPPQRIANADGLGVESATDRCRPFAATADGAGFGEGGGFVLLKPLAEATTDGDHVHAVLRGSAINHDGGRGNGITAPSPAGQAEVIAAAWRDAGLSTEDIGYIEAHGTGTRIGDPIEIQGLLEAGAQGLVSSAKGNVGHLSGMAGFAGLLRVIAQFRAGRVFPTAHFDEPNPLLGLAGDGPLRIASAPVDWPGPFRRAGVSGFGLSGTNAHVVLEEPPTVDEGPHPTGRRLVLVSARTAEGLATHLAALTEALAGETDLDAVADVLMLGREHLAYRWSTVATSVEDLRAQLTAACPKPTERRKLAIALGDVAVERLTTAHAPFAAFGITADLVLAHGAGAAAARVIRGELSLADALEQADALAGASAPNPDRLRAALDAAGDPLILDLAPGSALSHLLPATLPGSLLEALGALFDAGHDLDWAAGFGMSVTRRVELPLAPWAEEHCWPGSTTVVPVTHLSTADTVLDLVREVLKEPNLTAADDFFEIGGNSLNGAQLVGRLNTRFGIDLDVLDLFDCADLAALVELVDRSASASPLSGQQTAIWAATELDGITSAYSVPAALLLESEVDIAALDQKLTEIVARQPMLRAALTRTDDGARQVVRPPHEVRTTRSTIDLSGLTVTDGRDALLDRLRGLAARPLPAYDTPPARFELIRVEFADATRHVLMLTFHHLFFDGWSWRLVLDALGGAPPPEPGRSYLQYTADQMSMLDSSRGAELTAFWTDYLAGAASTPLPADADGSAGNLAGDSLPLTIDPHTVERLRFLARKRRVSVQMLLLAAWAALLWRISAARDVCVSMPVASRRPEDEHTVGCFVNTVLTRIRFDPKESVGKFLDTVRESTLRAVAHADLPADRILRLTGRTPITTTMFDFQSGFEPITRVGDSPAELLDVDPVGAKYPLNVTCVEYGGELQARMEFAAALIKPETARGWLAEYGELLTRIAEQGTEADLFTLTGSARRTSRRLPEPTARLLAEYTGGTATALAAATGVVLRRFGKAPQVPPSATFGEWLETVRTNPVASGMPPVDVDLLDGTLTVTATDADESTVDALASGILVVLERGLRDPGTPLLDLSILDEATTHTVLVEFNRTPELPAGTSFRDLVLAQAERRPNAIAIHDEHDEITYAGLVRYATRVAVTLRESGVGPQNIVALSARRDAWFVATAVGILFSGGAYLPLDPTLPPARREHMLRGVSTVITAADIRALRDLRGPTGELGPAPRPGDLAYVIFTSGSTGRPKGACIEHRNLVNLLAFRAANSDLRPGVELPQTAPITFDISVWQMLAGLTAGACVCVVPDDVVKDPAALARLMVEHRYEYIELVPSLISVLLETLADDPELRAALRAILRGLISTGEVLTTELARRWHEQLPGVPLLNAYGPAEATDDITQGPVAGNETSAFSPVGTPLPNAAVYVLDQDLQPLPPMITGEIYAGGPNVGRGYLGQTRLTASAFLPDPFRDVPGARMYRTGDRGRWRPDGVLEVLGRADNQVKVRGRRVELGEIESVLAAVPDVATCAVELIDERLVGFVAPAPGTAPTTGELIDALSAQLPEYMVPAEFRLLDALPTNRNGKIDRHELRAVAHSPTPVDTYVAPRTDLERVLCDLWAQHLKLDRVGIHDDFFALGGDSILGIRVANQAGRQGIALRPRHLLENPTVAALARVVTAAGEEAPPEPEGASAPLTPVQQWFFEQNFAQPHHWNQSAVLDAAEALDPAALRTALRRLVERHEQLRVRFPAGEARQVVGPVPDDLLWQADPDDEALVNRAHASLSLVDGRLIRAVLLGTHRVLLTVHHLAVDQVSWEILVEDLETAYRAIIAGTEPRFPARTAAFTQWAREVAKLPEPVPEPVDASALAVRVNAAVPNRYGNRAVAEVTVDAGVARPAVLLAGLSRAIARRYGDGHVVIEIEGHGRDKADGILDVTRTVGWFTTLGTMVLPVGPETTAEELRLDDRCTAEAQIGFNYLGRIDRSVDVAGLFTLGEDLGLRRAAGGHRPLEWEINAGILDDTLTITLEYVPGRHDPAEITSILEAWRDALDVLARNEDPTGRLLEAAPLTPTQLEFFDRDLPDPSHWNHGVLFTLSRALPLAEAERIATILLDRHPMLGAGFARTPSGWWQGRLRHPTLPVYEFEHTGDAAFSESADAGHRSLNLTTGPLARMHVYRGQEALGDQVLLIVHHLAVDPYSWDVLTGELTALLNGPVELPPTTTSYVDWARALHRMVYAQPHRLHPDYWLGQDWSAPRQLWDTEQTGRDSAMVEITHRFDSAWTETFLRPDRHDGLPAAARMLAVLGRAVETWLPGDDRDLLVELGGHGREDLFDHVDLGRTVGWFTTSYPFVLPHSAGRAPSEHADEVARRLREVPGRGLGFEALRYLAADPAIREKLGLVRKPVLRFDFDGELSFLDIAREAVSSSVTEVSTDGTGRWKPADAPLSHLLSINVSIHGGRLEIRWQFAGDIIGRPRIDALVSAMLDQLEAGNT